MQNDDIKITIVDDKNAINNISKQDSTIHHEKETLATNDETKKLSEQEYKETILDNLGFTVDHELFDKMDTDPKALLKIGIQALNGNQINFAKKVVSIALNRGDQSIACQLSELIKNKRGKYGSNKR